VAAFELTQLDPEVQKGLERAGIEVNGLFNEDDLAAAGEELESNSSAAPARVGERLGAQGRAGHA
jgi:hypothetical protein